jgi:hypothetical protein
MTPELKLEEYVVFQSMCSALVGKGMDCAPYVCPLHEGQTYTVGILLLLAVVIR